MPNAIMFQEIKTGALMNGSKRAPDFKGRLYSQALKRRIISSLPAFDAMRAAWLTMKQPQIQRSRV
jgi:hypothetical protein